MIRIQCSPEEADEIIRYAPGYGIDCDHNVIHAWHCQHRDDRKHPLDDSCVKHPGDCWEKFADGRSCRCYCHMQEPVYLRTFAVGLTVDKWEHNGYDDSDFYAVWFNPETEEFEKVCYATTRGWTYLNKAEIDAPRELRKKYRDHLESVKIAREKVVEEASRKAFEEGCSTLIGMVKDPEELYQLWKSGTAWDQILTMLSKAKRSKFRIDLRDKVVEWFNTPQDDRKYRTPLSRGQIASLMRYAR